MKMKHLFASLASLASLAMSATMAGSAQAALIAGWDFSQWFGDGLLSTDGATFQNTLDANYSTLDPTFGAGGEAAQYGTLFFDGSFGSTSVAAGSGTEEFLPTTASLGSNIDRPVLDGKAGDVPFDTFTVLANEGQTFTNPLSMLSTSAVSVVFQASVLSGATDWALTLGGQTFSGNVDIGVEFSTDGSNYSPITTLSLSTVDTPFSVLLPAVQTQAAFVRLNFAGANAKIDNVGISGTVVPEPGTLLLALAGMGGLAVYGRRRV